MNDPWLLGFNSLFDSYQLVECPYAMYYQWFLPFFGHFDVAYENGGLIGEIEINGLV